MKFTRYLHCKKIVASILFTPILFGCAQLSQDSNNKDDLIKSKVDSLAKQYAERDLLNGTIMISQGDHIIFNQSYGYANWELMVPNSATTRFGVASITKTFTETILTLLIKEGKVHLDDTVEKYLPGFPHGPAGGIPTIKDLLYHHAGVPHRVTNSLDETQLLHPSDIVERVKSSGLLFEPGSQRQYSSAGYTCLARVIEVIENKNYDESIKERVFSPANMTSAINETGQRLMSDRANPYRLGVDDEDLVVVNAPYKNLRFLTGAGSVYATAEDMVHFIQAMKKGVFGKTSWKDTFGEDTLSWGSFLGRTNGFESSVDVLPANDIVFVFLSNLQSASNWQIRAQIQSILANADPESYELPPPVAKLFEDPKSLLGQYGSAEILMIDGKLFRGDNEFYPIENEMYYIPASGTKMRFRKDALNNVDALINIRPDGGENILERSN